MSTTGEKVAAIKQAWREASATAVMDLDLMATVAVNVLTDWDKRPGRIEDTTVTRHTKSGEM